MGRIILLIFLMFFIFGCAASIPEPKIARSEVSSSILSKEARFERVRIRSKADYYSSKVVDRVAGRDVIISAMKPGFLRVTLLSFDKALSTLVSDGKLFWLIDTMQDAFVYGKASPSNIQRILPIQMTPTDFVRVLSGQLPVELLGEDFSSKAEFGWDSTKGGYFYVLKKRGMHLFMYFSSKAPYDLVGLDMWKSGKLHFQYEAKSHRGEGAERHPRRIRLWVASDGGAELILRVEKWEVGVEFKEGVFKLEAPAGMKQIKL